MLAWRCIKALLFSRKERPWVQVVVSCLGPSHWLQREKETRSVGSD